MKRFVGLTITVSLICLLLPLSSWTAAWPDGKKTLYSCWVHTRGAIGVFYSLDITGDRNIDIADGTPNQFDLVDGDTMTFRIFVAPRR